MACLTHSVLIYFLLKLSAATDEASCELQRPDADALDHTLEARQYALESYRAHAAQAKDIKELEQLLEEGRGEWKGAETALGIFEEVLGEQLRHEEAQSNVALRLAHWDNASSQESAGIMTVLDFLNEDVGIEIDAEDNSSVPAETSYNKDIVSSTEVMECAESIIISGAEAAQPSRMGVFRQMQLPGTALHRSRPLYENDHGVFLFYWEPYKDWLVGSNTSYGLASTGDLQAPCPELASGWKAYVGGKWTKKYSITVSDGSVRESLAVDPASGPSPLTAGSGAVITSQDIKVVSESTKRIEAKDASSGLAGLLSSMTIAEA